MTIWANFSQMGYFRSETEKMNIVIEFRILEKLSLPYNFELASPLNSTYSKSKSLFSLQPKKLRRHWL